MRRQIYFGKMNNRINTLIIIDNVDNKEVILKKMFFCCPTGEIIRGYSWFGPVTCFTTC